MKTENKKIRELISEDLIYASVLYYFGVEFYDYSEMTLKQVCREKGLNPRLVIESFESEKKAANQQNIQLSSYPIDLIIEFLKHSHYIFIKKKLPYLVRLIEGYQSTNSKNYQFIDDLEMVFPLFVEDFIHHIYEEEDTLFEYIQELNRSLQGKINQSQLYYKMENNSVQKFAMDHELHEDEMTGIRKITDHYKLREEYDLAVKVIISELQHFDHELTRHAEIEDRILFPKAMALENDVREMLGSKIKFN